MNVLNKLKSKKAKEPLRVNEEVIEQIKVESQVESNKSFQKKEQIRPNTNIFFERQSAPRITSQKSKSQMESDVDEATLSEYFNKKDKKIAPTKLESQNKIKQQDFKSGVCLNIKKGYTIGSICLFQGELISKKQGKEDRRRKISASCAYETIQYPQGISKIFLSKITYISEDELVFVGEDILKVVEKGHSKKV